MPLSLLLLVAAAGNLTPATDILAQIRAGRMLCSNPDAATKTCSAINAYADADDGGLIETDEFLLSPDRAVTLEVSLSVGIDHGAICGVLALADLEKGKVRLDGALVPADRNAAALEKIVERMKPMTGRRTCDTLRVEGGQLLKFGQVERIEINLPGKPVRWITAADGYRVAPR
jgi:hypothetical protein